MVRNVHKVVCTASHNLGLVLTVQSRKVSQIRFGYVGTVCDIGHCVSSATVTVKRDVCTGWGAALLAVVGWHGRGSFTWRLCVEKTSVVSFLFFSGSTRRLFNNTTLLIGDSGQASCVLVNDVKTAQNENHRYGEHGEDHQRDAHSQAPGWVAERLFLSLRTDKAFGLF